MTPKKPHNKPVWAGDSMKAFSVLRVSSLKQADGTSLESQRDGILGYAKANGLEVVETFEIHESAKDSKERFKFHSMLRESSSRKIRHVIFWQNDRITRNNTDGELIEKRARSGENVFHIAGDRRVLHRGTPDSEWVMQDLGTVTAKSYVRDLRRRACESMRHKAECGWFPGRPKFLYKNEKIVGTDGQVRDRGGTIALTEWGARAGTRMKELRLAGTSLALIADKVLEEGLIPERYRQRFRGPGRAARVEHILKSRFYVGEFEWGGNVYPGKHQALFTLEEWLALQGTFGGVPAPLRADNNNAPLAGMLRCGECGCAITFEQKTKKKSGRQFRYLRCANGRGVHRSLTYVPESEVFAGFSAAIEAVAVDYEIAEQVAEILNEDAVAVKAARRKEAARFQAELASLEHREDQLYDELTRGVLDDEGYRRQLTRLRVQRAEAAKKVEAANQDLDDAWQETTRRTLELARTAKTVWDSRSGAEKRALLDVVVSNPTLTGRKVSFELKKPFAVLAEIRQKGVGRAP